MQFSSMVFEWLARECDQIRYSVEDVTPAVAHLIECPDFEMKPLRPIAKPIK